MVHRRYVAPVLVSVLLLFSGCSAQEAPFFPTEKFEEGVMHRTNMCERHRQLYLDEISLPDALRGLNLSVVLTDYWEPISQEFFTLTKDGVINAERPPLFAVIMDELARRAGFAWRNSFGVVKPLNKEKDINKTWSDLLEWEVNTYDIAMGKWDRTTSRIANEISFPEGWYDASIILVHAEKEEDLSLNIWSFLLPFQPMVWFVIVISVVVSGLLYYFLERLDASSDARQLEGSPTGAVYYSFISFVGHNEFKPQTNAARLIAFSLAFWALITGAAYTANLASFLVARRQPEESIQSVQDAILMRAPICVQDNVALDQYVTNRYPSAVLRRKQTEGAVFEAVVSGECPVGLVPNFSFETYRRSGQINSECSLAWKGRVERYVPSGLATLVDTGSLCTSLVGFVLDYHLLEMQTDGFIERAWENYLERIGDINCPNSDSTVGNVEEDEDTYSLSIQEMSGIFIVHGIFCSFAVLIASIQYIRKKRRGGNVKMESSAKHEETAECSSDEDYVGSPEQVEDDLVLMPSYHMNT